MWWRGGVSSLWKCPLPCPPLWKTGVQDKFQLIDTPHAWDSGAQVRVYSISWASRAPTSVLRRCGHIFLERIWDIDLQLCHPLRQETDSKVMGTDDQGGGCGNPDGLHGESQNVGETWDPTMRLSTSLRANCFNLSVKLFADNILHCKCFKMFLPSNPTPHTLVICTKQE